MRKHDGRSRCRSTSRRQHVLVLGVTITARCFRRSCNYRLSGLEASCDLSVLAEAIETWSWPNVHFIRYADLQGLAQEMAINPQSSIVANEDTNTIVESIKVTETPGIKADGLGLATWGSARLLSGILDTLEIPPPTQTCSTDIGVEVLELGAGTGLVGLTAAIIWKCNVMLTDMPTILPGLQANIDVNRPLLASHGALVRCGALDWSSPSAIQVYQDETIFEPVSLSKPSVILAADTLYDSDHAPWLVDTVKKWLAHDIKSRVVLCYPLRIAYVDVVRDFWDLMHASGFECAQEGRIPGQEEFGEVPGTEFEWCVWRWNHSQSR